jgi:NAD(P)-dependent dehydrogenase (short-subunit alcohol dehydrogenase family)
VEATAKTLSEAGGTCIAKLLDVRDLDSFERTFNDCAEKLGGIDIMVNNAARTVQCSLWDVTPQDCDDVQATNLRSAFFGTCLLRHSDRRTPPARQKVGPHYQSSLHCRPDRRPGCWGTLRYL